MPLQASPIPIQAEEAPLQALGKRAKGKANAKMARVSLLAAQYTKEPCWPAPAHSRSSVNGSDNDNHPPPLTHHYTHTHTHKGNSEITDCRKESLVEEPRGQPEQ